MARDQEPVVVVGLGRFGTALALELHRRGTEVLAIDDQREVVQRLSGQLSQVVTADATDADALREIGVPEFRRGVVAIGTHLQASILTTALLADLGVDRIWAKALDRQHASILQRVGAAHVVLPEHDMGERVAHLVSGRLLDYLEVDSNWVFAKTTAPSYLVGTPLGQTRLRAEHKVTVVSVRPRDSAGFTHAGIDTVLAQGDHIVVAGRPGDVERFVDSL